MDPMQVFTQVKELIEKKDIEGAKKFVEENKDQLGDYLEQAQALLQGNEVANNALNAVKGLFGK
ncbi:hypothetical protein ACFQY8_04910 [Alloscardovia venturai]|uniref:Isoleucyl-tRNA synthetase n=1 Tax=Alloscardovia venturai TaxID=1769421 RepID=A0ABW2Y4A5_9BIFI